MGEALQFDATRPENRVDGRVVPSVTQILGILTDFGAVPAEVLARAAEFGQHVHQACALANDHRLDEGALDPALAPYLVGWRRCLADLKATVVASEWPLVDARLGFAGTLDAVLLIRGRTVLVDIKTGVVPRTVGPQLAAYAHLLQRANGQPKLARRLCVQLTGDGYRLHDCKDNGDFSVFLSCLNVWNFMNRAGR